MNQLENVHPENEGGFIAPVVLRVSAGDQFHQLFFALLEQRKSYTEDTIADYDPNDLDSHVERMHDLELLDDLLIQLVTGLNFASKQAEQEWMSDEALVRHADSKRERVNRELKRWQEKASRRYRKSTDL